MKVSFYRSYQMKRKNRMNCTKQVLSITHHEVGAKADENIQLASESFSLNRRP